MKNQLTGHALRIHFQEQVSTGKIDKDGIKKVALSEGWRLIREQSEFITFESQPNSFRFRIYFSSEPSNDTDAKPKQFASDPMARPLTDLKDHFVYLLLTTKSDGSLMGYLSHSSSLHARLSTHLKDDLTPQNNGRFASDVFHAASDPSKVLVSILDITPDHRFLPVLKAHWISLLTSGGIDLPHTAKMPQTAKVFFGPQFVDTPTAQTIAKAAIKSSIPLSHFLQNTNQAGAYDLYERLRAIAK